MAITLTVSNGKLIPSADFYSPSNGEVELTLSAGAFINQYSPVDHDVTVYQWQYDSEKVELAYGSVTPENDSYSFELKFGCEFFVIGLRVGKHETIQTVPIHIGASGEGGDDEGGGGGSLEPLYVRTKARSDPEDLTASYIELYLTDFAASTMGDPATGTVLLNAINAGRQIYLTDNSGMHMAVLGWAVGNGPAVVGIRFAVVTTSGVEYDEFADGTADTPPYQYNGGVH